MIYYKWLLCGLTPFAITLAATLNADPLIASFFPSGRGNKDKVTADQQCVSPKTRQNAEACVVKAIEQCLVEEPCCPPVMGNWYFGGAAAYGRMVPGNDALIESALLQEIIAIVGNISVQSGGFAWRAFGGALAKISERVSLGGEVGFSHYPKTVAKINNPVDLIPIIGSVTATGYGADLLVNITTYVIPEFSISFKPGLQLARQNNRVFLSLEDFGLLSINVPLIFRDKYNLTQVCPQLIMSTGWYFKCPHIMVEAYYQHVWGVDPAPVDNRISSRDAIGATFSFVF